MWSAEEPGEPLILRGHEGTIYTAAWSPEGDRVLTAGTDRTARLWGDLTSIRSPDEPRLWTATTYCLSVERRVELVQMPAQAVEHARALLHEVLAVVDKQAQLALRAVQPCHGEAALA